MDKSELAGGILNAFDGNGNEMGESSVRWSAGTQGVARGLQGMSKTAKLGGLLASEKFAKRIPLISMGAGGFDAAMGVSQDDQGFLSQMGTGGYQFADGATAGIAGKGLDALGFGEDGKSYGQIITENEARGKKYEAEGKELGSFNEAKRERWATLSESDQAAQQEYEASLSKEDRAARSEQMKAVGHNWNEMNAEERKTALEQIQGKQGPSLSNIVDDVKDAGTKGLDKVKKWDGFEKAKEMFLDKDGKLTGWGTAGLVGGGVLAATAAMKMLHRDEPELEQSQGMPQMAPMYAGMPQQYVPVAVDPATMQPQQPGMTF